MKSLMADTLRFGPLIFAVAVMLLPSANAQESDRVTGLIKEEGWQLVQANCTECHTAQIIMQNSGNREVWKSRIAWMQNTQGLGELDNDVENSIVNYLSTNYGQKDASRRAGLSAHLFPDNPYSEAK
ncbi:MAG: hypothetical protein COA96_05065 [SAR86 cluster bacterium]|uniref:Quinohemoprotein amine dehydrogenase alpha subunit haem binding domain-containing protein n=1 Tax=SAR86 cluster bacterium TaxID=2030880 RepID=A0A2A5B5Q2_9GAMM|nr:MAG: hypothetical protein COA96_05065 [SAR86 cluster bacterium]